MRPPDFTRPCRPDVEKCRFRSVDGDCARNTRFRKVDRSAPPLSTKPHIGPNPHRAIRQLARSALRPCEGYHLTGTPSDASPNTSPIFAKTFESPNQTRLGPHCRRVSTLSRTIRLRKFSYFTASCNGVSPSWSRTPRVAPAPSSNSSIAVSPKSTLAAQWRGVEPVLST